MPDPLPILAIDPGRDKCGLAAVLPDGSVAARAIVPSAELAAAAAEWARRWPGCRILVGRGTGSRAARRQLAQLGLRAQPAPESGTTLRARSLYFQDHPPRGWRRCVPLGLQTPPVPVDDYAAVLIARDHIAQEVGRASGND